MGVADGLRGSPLGNRRCRVERLPRVRLFAIEEHAAITINFEAEFAGFSMISAETGTC
jgi:hypothetical protein